MIIEEKRQQVLDAIRDCLRSGWTGDSVPLRIRGAYEDYLRVVAVHETRGIKDPPYREPREP